MEELTKEKVYQDLKELLQGAGESLPEWYFVIREQTINIALAEGIISLIVSLVLLFVIYKTIISFWGRIKNDTSNGAEIIDVFLVSFFLFLFSLTFLGFMLHNMYTSIRCYVAPDICTVEKIERMIPQN